MTAIHDASQSPGGPPNGSAHAEDALERATIKRLLVKILPFLILCYIVAFLDRVNLGFAASYMNEDLGLTATLFGFGAGIFAIGYFFFEVPSNLVLHRVGARIWIARIMVTWGLVSACTAFVQGPVSFTIVRFLLGVAEAGFFPGIVLYLSLWFPRRALGRATALFILGLPASMLVGAPLSTALISWMHDVAGFSGWQWMFLVEGGMAVVVGVCVFFVLNDNPAKAKFLTEEQREWLVRTLASERSAKEAVRRYSTMETLRNRRVIVLSLCIFCNITALFGITLWMPQVIESFGNVSSTQATLLTAIPYLVAGVAMVLNANHSDKTAERRFHILIPALVGCAGLILAVSTSSPLIGLIGLCLGAAGILSSNILFWGIPSMFLTGAAAAAGIAMVNSIGNLGGFVGPYLTGWARDASGSHAAGMYLLGAMAALYGIALFSYLTVQRRADAAAARAAGVEDTTAVEV